MPLPPLPISLLQTWAICNLNQWWVVCPCEKRKQLPKLYIILMLKNRMNCFVLFLGIVLHVFHLIDEYWNLSSRSWCIFMICIHCYMKHQYYIIFRWFRFAEIWGMTNHYYNDLTWWAVNNINSDGSCQAKWVLAQIGSQVISGLISPLMNRGRW